MLWKLDESVGKVVKALEDAKMLENCIIVFTTDNGGPAGGFNSNAASNWPLRGVSCVFKVLVLFIYLLDNLLPLLRGWGSTAPRKERLRVIGG